MTSCTDPTELQDMGAKMATYYVRDGQLIRKGGTCDCKIPCTEVVKVDALASLTEQNERLRGALLALTDEVSAIVAFDADKRLQSRIADARAALKSATP